MSLHDTPKKKEPVAISTAIVALIAAVGPVLIAFDIPVTDAQIGAVMGLVTAVVAVITGVITRGKVTAPEKPAKPISSDKQV